MECAGHPCSCLARSHYVHSVEVFQTQVLVMYVSYRKSLVEFYCILYERSRHYAFNRSFKRRKDQPGRPVPVEAGQLVYIVDQSLFDWLAAINFLSDSEYIFSLTGPSCNKNHT